MATTTQNLGLIKPAGTDKIRIAQINSNMDTLDAKIGPVGSTSLQAQINNKDSAPTSGSTNPVTSGGVYTEAGKLAAGMAILATNNTHAAIASGQYVYVRGHGSLSEGLYRATAAIAANGTLSTSNLTAVSGGGLNALKSSVDTLNTNLTSYQYISNRALSALVTSIDDGDDLNTFTTPGMYYSNNKTVSNAPYATTYFHLMVFGFNGTVIQIWYNLGGVLVYVRGIYGTTIGTWNKIQMVTA